jgi:hypothetical protein
MYLTTSSLAAAPAAQASDVICENVGFYLGTPLGTIAPRGTQRLADE